MKKSKFTDSQIMDALKRAEAGVAVPEICRELIDTIALLHQCQREVKTVHHAGETMEYIEVTLADIEAANRIVHEVLGRSLDELPPVTRKVLEAIVEAVKAKPLPRESVRFSRREVRAWTGQSDTQARAHLDRLVELEYLLTHRGKRGQSFEYELIYDGDGSDSTHLAGLIDTATIQSSRGKNGQFAGATRPQNAPISAPSRAAPIPADADEISAMAESDEDAREMHFCPDKNPGFVVPYPQEHV
nr:hypothetical protein [Paraburkholderia sp. SOS3]